MKKNQSITKKQTNTITDPAELGQIMNAAATQDVFSDYLSRKSQNTKNRHARELTAF